jgi:hypothetical protein
VGDPELRLPGERESETSPLLEDALHWKQVYVELLMFRRTLPRAADVHEAAAPEPAVEEVPVDRALHGSELERLSRRHDFWRERVRQLQGS